MSSRRVGWEGRTARMGEIRNAYKILVGKPQNKISLQRPRSRWEDNIKMDYKGIGYEYVDWIWSKGRLFYHDNEFLSSFKRRGNFLTRWATVSFSWMTLIHGVIYLVTLWLIDWIIYAAYQFFWLVLYCTSCANKTVHVTVFKAHSMR